MGDNETQLKTEVFLSWLSKIGVFMSPKMAITQMADGRGRRVVAVEEFGEDELVFSVPRSAVLNVNTATRNPNILSLQAAMQTMPSPWLVLTTIMLVEGLQHDSIYSPYLDILPRHLDSLIFWSEEELAELQASMVVKKIGKQGAEDMFSEHISPIGLANVNTKNCHLAASIIMAYAFDIPERTLTDVEEPADSREDDLVSDHEDDEKTILSMVPLADMLNADADRNNARLCCDNEDLEMRTTKTILKNEEIFNDYGPLPRSDLLRRYGYVTDNYAPYDVAEISTETILKILRGKIQLEKQSLDPLEDAELEKRIKLAEREDIYEESYDLGHTGNDAPSIPDELLAFIYLFLLDDTSLAAIESSQSDLPNRTKFGTELVGQVLGYIIQQREKEYATSLEDDEELLRRGNASRRETMAIQVRSGEKKVLRVAMREAANLTGSNKRMRLQSDPIAKASQGKRKPYDIAEVKKKRRIA